MCVKKLYFYHSKKQPDSLFLSVKCKIQYNELML